MTRDLLLTEEAPSRRRIIGGLRNLVLAASGAAATHRLIVPARDLVNPADASARVQHHLEGLKQAFADLYPRGEVYTRGTHRREDEPDIAGRFMRGDLAGAFVITLDTDPEAYSAFLIEEGKKAGLWL